MFSRAMEDRVEENAWEGRDEAVQLQKQEYRKVLPCILGNLLRSPVL
jgi:hypothetical protein